MPVEVATTIAQLNPLWPLGTDEKEEGDNHLRLLKVVLQSDAFSKAAGARSPFQAKAAGYTAVAADSGTVFVFSAAATLALTAAATLATGWFCTVVAPVNGDVLIDPNAAELIDGVASVKVRAGRSCKVFCDGTRFVTDRVQNMGWELIDVRSPVGSNSTAWTDLGDFRRVKLSGSVMGTADAIGQLTVSVNNGVSYLTGATDYSFGWHYGTSGNAYNAGIANNANISIPITTFLAANVWTFEQEFHNFNQAMSSRGLSRNEVIAVGGTRYIAHQSGVLNGVVARNAMKLTLSAGNFAAGTLFSLEGMRG